MVLTTSNPRRFHGRDGQRQRGEIWECRPASSTGRVALITDDDSTGKELTMSGYCLKCRAHREMQNAEEVTLKNGRAATRGKCGECGTAMFRMGGAMVKG